jgi:hypothetical protein
VKGSNLAQRAYVLPVDFEGALNVVAIPFQMWQQAQVDTWIPVLDALERQVPGLRYYELPVIRAMNRASQWFIDEGMRGGIRDQATRARTITLYTDKQAFRRALGLPHENQVYLLLVDRQGQVLWQEAGAFRPEAAKTLVEAIGQTMAVA